MPHLYQPEIKNYASSIEVKLELEKCYQLSRIATALEIANRFKQDELRGKKIMISDPLV